jgi:Nitrile hydratase beta subunit
VSTPEATHRFHVGDRVRVKRANPAGNPRTPAYVRGKGGTVTVLHGSIVNHGALA